MKDSVFACLLVINIYFVLEIFNENLFAVSQIITFAISRLTEFAHLGTSGLYIRQKQKHRAQIKDKTILLETAYKIKDKC